MDRTNILIATLAGAALGAIIGALLPEETGKRLVNSASEGIKDVSNRVSEYAKQNIPGMKRETQRTSYESSL